MEKNETPKNLALLTADEVALSILEVDAEGVRIKLWPDVNAVRAHLEECCERMPGGLAGYSVRHYVCGRYLYCAVALADITKDAPCPTTYRVSSDAPSNEADGSFLAAAAAWSIGAGVLNLPPLRIPASKVHIVPQGKPGTNIIERYVLDDALTLDDGMTGGSVRPRRFSLQRSPPCPTSAGTATPATAISASCTTRVTAPCSAG